MHTLITCLLTGGAICGIGYCWGWRDRGRAVFGVPKMENPPLPPEIMPNGLPKFTAPPHPLRECQVLPDITAKQCEICDRLIDCGDTLCAHSKNGYCQIFLNRSMRNSKNLLN